MSRRESDDRLHPEQPYMSSAHAVYDSGFERDLVYYGAPCSECPQNAVKRKTYLDAGVPHCATHLIGYCKHGFTGFCHDGCGLPRNGASIIGHRLRRARTLDESRMIREGKSQP